MWNFPNQRLNPCSHSGRAVLTTGSPGKPSSYFSLGLKGLVGFDWARFNWFAVWVQSCFMCLPDQYLQSLLFTKQKARTQESKPSNANTFSISLCLAHQQAKAIIWLCLKLRDEEFLSVYHEALGKVWHCNTIAGSHKWRL